MHMCQLVLTGSYFHSNLVAEHIVVIFRLKLEDAFDNFDEVEMKIKELEDRTAMQLYK